MSEEIEKIPFRKRFKLVQSELKAPKKQKNTFGKYNYRSNEDILEALKPLLAKYEITVTQSDEIVQIGNRYYIKAISIAQDVDHNSKHLMEATAYAREPENKKGMDESQITGAASSYARKYSLNGLFGIDDNKDPDTMKPPVDTPKPKPKADPKHNGKSLEELYPSLAAKASTIEEWEKVGQWLISHKADVPLLERHANDFENWKDFHQPIIEYPEMK